MDLDPWLTMVYFTYIHIFYLFYMAGDGISSLIQWVRIFYYLLLLLLSMLQFSQFLPVGAPLMWSSCVFDIPILIGAFLCLLAQEDVLCSSCILWAILSAQPFLQRDLFPFIRAWYVEIKPRHALCSLLMLCPSACAYTHPAYIPLYIYR